MKNNNEDCIKVNGKPSRHVYENNTGKCAKCWKLLEPNNPLDRKELLDSLMCLMDGIGFVHSDFRDAAWMYYEDFRSHCVGWTDEMLITTYQEYVSKLVNLYLKNKKICSQTNNQP